MCSVKTNGANPVRLRRATLVEGSLVQSLHGGSIPPISTRLTKPLQSRGFVRSWQATKESSALSEECNDESNGHILNLCTSSILLRMISNSCMLVSQMICKLGCTIITQGGAHNPRKAERSSGWCFTKIMPLSRLHGSEKFKSRNGDERRKKC